MIHDDAMFHLFFDYSEKNLFVMIKMNSANFTNSLSNLYELIIIIASHLASNKTFRKRIDFIE